jgi:hypothetical protein
VALVPLGQTLPQLPQSLVVSSRAQLPEHQP